MYSRILKGALRNSKYIYLKASMVFNFIICENILRYNFLKNERHKLNFPNHSIIYSTKIYNSILSSQSVFHNSFDIRQ